MQTREPTRRRPGYFPGAAATLLPLALAACGDSPAVAGGGRRTAQAVRIERVELQAVTPSLSATGVVQAAARIALAFRVDGYIERFEVDEGDRVEAGQVLAKLDDADLRREVRAAQADLEWARAQLADTRRTFERQEKLLERDTTSQQHYDEARSRFEMAHAERERARVRLETAEDRVAKAVLRAPVSGSIERRLSEEHERAAADAPVLILTELDTVTVRAAVPDSDLAGVRLGGRARVHTPSRPDRSFEGTIRQIGVAADPSTRTVPFEVEIENAEGLLRPELVAEVEIPLGEPEPSILVPLAAVLRDADTQPFCFVSIRDGDADRAERRSLRLGPLQGDRIAVRGGLEPGDRLITRGQHFLRAGDPVRRVE